MSSNISNFSVISRVTRLDIFIMYSLMFPLSLYCIEISLDKMVLVSTFSDPMNQSIIWLRKLLAFSSSGITTLIVSRIECFMIIRLMRLERFHFSKLALCFAVLSLVRSGGHSVRTAWSRSIHPSKIIICSFQFPKLVPLSTRMLFMLADIMEALIVYKIK